MWPSVGICGDSSRNGGRPRLAVIRVCWVCWPVNSTERDGEQGVVLTWKLPRLTPRLSRRSCPGSGTASGRSRWARCWSVTISRMFGLRPAGRCSAGAPSKGPARLAAPLAPASLSRSRRRMLASWCSANGQTVGFFGEVEAAEEGLDVQQVALDLDVAQQRALEQAALAGQQGVHEALVHAQLERGARGNAAVQLGHAAAHFQRPLLADIGELEAQGHLHIAGLVRVDAGHPVAEEGLRGEV